MWKYNISWINILLCFIYLLNTAIEGTCLLQGKVHLHQVQTSPNKNTKVLCASNGCNLLTFINYTSQWWVLPHVGMRQSTLTEFQPVWWNSIHNEFVTLKHFLAEILWPFLGVFMWLLPFLAIFSVIKLYNINSSQMSRFCIEISQWIWLMMYQIPDGIL